MARHWHGHSHEHAKPRSFRERVSQWALGIRQTPQIVAMLWRAYPLGAILLPILTVAIGPLPAASVYCLKKVLDGVSQWMAHGAEAGQHQVTLFFILGFAALLLQRGLDRVMRYVQAILEARLRYHIENKLAIHAVSLDVGFFETPDFYDKLQRAQREVSFRPVQVVFSLASGAQALTTVISYAALLATLAWWLIPYLIVLSLPGLIVRTRYGHRGWMLVRGRTAEERVMFYYRGLVTSEQEAKELRLFGLGEYLLDRWRTLFWKFFHQDRRLAAVRNIADFGATLFSTAAYAAFYAYAIHRTIADPAVTIGSLVMYTQCMERAVGEFSSIMRTIGDLYENHLYLSNLFEYFELGPSVTAPSKPLPPPAPIRQGLRFEDVSFRYPGGREGKWVLEGVSFDVAPGEKIALVGENGAGKTTIIKLLARLYDPQHGRVTVDGVDLRQMDPAAWQRNIGVIFQDFARYAVTARENVGFGELEHVEDLERIRAAAEMSGALDCIERLPRGWENVLGKRFEEGQELSVGEWQKVALARAFLREAQILVLDEPTASLDAKQEYEIFRRFNELARGKSTVLISHRFSSVRMADRIFVIERGRMVESGTHEELMDARGRYAELFTRQAAAYR